MVDSLGARTYGELLAASAERASALLGLGSDLAEEPIPFLCPPGVDYAATQWGIWRAGGIAVPLALSHPPAEWAHVLTDTGARRLLVAEEFHQRTAPLCRELAVELVPLAARPGASAAASRLPQLGPERRALLLYTSGTTGKPKGVVWTFGMLGFQLETLTRAWGWRPEDRALHLLPLHHVHGIVNILGCALHAGACCEFLPRFEPERVWERLASGEVTVFMAVPTIYHRLIEAWEAAEEATRQRWGAAAARLRLCVSGSAALPVKLFERWREIAAVPPLERYGMTEIGMALSNPLEGERRAGSVGRPLPGVEVRVVEEDGTLAAAGSPGELQVRGAGVFHEYWRRPAETAASFAAGGWFKTGDVAVLEAGAFRLLGRSSTDILKTGGYKVSALEIESALAEHPAIAECAVVAVPDEEWGERVGAAVVLKPGARLSLEELRQWGAAHLAPYKLPTRLLELESLPRNALGKVVKPELARRFAGRRGAP